MKKTIQGTVYDTDKAQKICDIWEGNRSDFRHLDAALYQTPRSKNFFLAGFGGAMTIFSKRCSDGSYVGDERILPLSDIDAREYCEKYANHLVETFFKTKEA